MSKMPVRISSLLLFCVSTFIPLCAQRKTTDPKHENHYQVRPIETNEVIILFTGAHSQQEFTTAKIKVVNKTTDFILFKTNEAIFKYTFGEYHPAAGSRGNKMVVLPGNSDTRTLKVKGGTQFHVDSLLVVLNGFSWVASEGKIQEGPEFKLSASTNDFEAGSFKCSLDKLKKESRETEVSFRCSYKGKDIGIIDPTKIVLRLENEQEYANEDKKGQIELALSGEVIILSAFFRAPGKVIDMRSANMVLVWKDTFMESKVVPISVGKASFVLDLALTADQNK